jgi:TP901 family phage tail tape measure protein
MSESDLNVKIVVDTDASPVDRLVKSLEKLEKIAAQLANSVPEVVGALSDFVSAAQSSAQSSEGAAKAAKNLNNALGDSSGADKSSQNLQGYVKTVNELRIALGKPQVAPRFFPDTKSAAAEIKVLEDELLKLLNVYRTSFGQKELLREAFTTEGAIRELNALKTQIDTTLTRIDVPRDAVTVATELRQEIDKLSQSSATASPLLLLADLQENRAEALKTIDTIEKLKLELIEIGPAARDGNEQAVQQFGKLSNKLNEAEGDARRLTSVLQDTSKVFDIAVGGANIELGSFGFRQIKLEDIFPSQEQAKVAQLGERINAEVVKSITQGAVQDSINAFLRTANQTAILNRRRGRGEDELPNVQLEDVSERSLQNLTQLTSHLPRLRYALYDTSNTLAIFGAGLLGISVGAIKVAADFERAFADVERVTDFDESGLARLRDDLIDISKSIPVSFEEITAIATLAGQLNVAEESIGNFSESVAKFAATTDVTIEASATAFGRLDQLVEGVDGQFDKLGSAILAVGVDSVATESEIIKIAGQIASIANIAGFSAGELIGFSSALASVGTRPELSRGTFTRLFSEINQAVSGTSDSLDKFAQLAGQSSQEFIDIWTAGEGASQIIEILRGLSVQGAEAELSLRALGITSVRDVPTLLKLAQNVEEVERQLGVATLGFIAGTELQEQYSVISATLSEKLVVLKNNFQAFTSSLAGATGPLTVFVDGIIQLISFLEKLIRNPFAQFVLTAIIAVVGITGALSIAASGVVRFTAALAGGLTSMIELRTATAITQVSVAGLNTTLNGTAAAAGAAGAAVGGLATATGALGGVAGIAGGAVGIGGVNAAIRAGLDGTVKSESATKKLALSFAGLFKNSKAVAGLRIAAPFLGWVGVALAAASAVDAVGRSFGAWGNQVESSIDDIGPYIESVKQDTLDWADSTEEVQKSFTTFEGSLSGSGEELDDYVRFVISASEENSVLRSLVDETTGAMETQTFAIGENTKALIRNDLVRKLFESSQNPGFFAGPEEQTLAQARRGFIASVSDPEIAEALAERGFDFTKFVDLVVTGQREAADAMLKELKPAALDIIETMDGISPKGLSDLAYAAQFGYNAIQPLVGLGSEIQEELTLMEFGAIAAGESILDAGDESEFAASKFDELRESFNLVFGEVDQIQAVYSSLQALDSAIEENGTSFDTLSANGIANLLALQAATVTLIANAEALGLDTSQAIALAYAQLVASGVEAAQALILVTRAAEGLGVEVPGAAALAAAVARLDNIFAGVERSAGGAAKEVKTFAEAARELTSTLFEGINVGRATEEAIFALGEAFGEGGKEALYAGEEMQGAIEAILGSSSNGEEAVANLASLFIKLANTVGSQTDPSLNILRQTINAVAQQFGITTSQVEQFIKTAGGDLANINLDNFNRGIKNAQKEVRTLLDYANDLRQIFTRAFDIRFSRTNAIDNLAEAWDNVGQSIEDARFEVDELLASQQDLSADRAIKQYFLSVAESYNDALRAAQLRKELSELDRDEAENQKRLLEAQQIAGGDLTSQGPGARQNRQDLLGLVKNYQDYITALAESGATQDELTAATEKARREFTEQARELGFQEADIRQYAAAFDDVQTAISRVERNITVEANVNPALQALNELNASLNAQIQAANDLNRALNQPVQQRLPGTPVDTAKQARARAIQAEIDRLERLIRINPGSIFNGRNQALANQLKARLASGNYAQGGFTGRGGKMEPAGIVHRGEYVIPKQFVNQSSGMPDPSFLAQMQSGMRNYFMGGFVGGGGGTDGGTMMVELSPFDRKLLADAGNVQLRLNGRVVAEATNQNNFDEARRGSN